MAGLGPMGFPGLQVLAGAVGFAGLGLAAPQDDAHCKLVPHGYGVLLTGDQRASLHEVQPQSWLSFRHEKVEARGW